MKKLLYRIARQDEGVLTFEWILLATLLVIGIVGGVSGMRDAVISELGDVSGAVVNIDQSYTVVTDTCSGLGNDFGFQDSLPACTGTGTRPATPPHTQGPTKSMCP